MSRIVGISREKGRDVFVEMLLALSLQIFANDEMTGVATARDGQIIPWVKRGVVTSVSSKIHPEEAKSLMGNCGIGYVSSCGLMMPEFCETGDGLAFAVAVDGSEIAQKQVVAAICKATTLRDGVIRAMKQVSIPFALIAMSSLGEIVGARRDGRKPLSVGKLDGGMYLSSQSGILDQGAEFLHSVWPGEIITLGTYGYQRKAVLPVVDHSRCIDEVLFLQRPGNICGGQSVEKIRIREGRALGKLFLGLPFFNEDAEYLIMQIPDGGNYPAIGFASAHSFFKYDSSAQVKCRYVNVPNVPLPVKYSLNGWIPDQENPGKMTNIYFKGKRIVLVDDGLWSGSKLIHFRKMLEQAGALEVHGVTVTVSCRSCPYGNDGHDLGSAPIGMGKSGQEIAKLLGLASFNFLPEEELIDSLGTPHRIYCTECLCY
ncbi:MAG: hypothetical protein NTW50_04495 [Candidatus Berkelbacteria bacterium]|nr:hypothetical protein [Candidatus Berkelbacteria bacterium]